MLCTRKHAPVPETKGSIERASCWRRGDATARCRAWLMTRSSSCSGAHHVLAVVEEPLRDGLHLRAAADGDDARRRVADRLVHHAGLQDTPGNAY